MSLLSGLFTELEKVPAPRLVIAENVARMAAPANRQSEVQTPAPKSSGTGGHYTKKAVSHAGAPTEIAENFPASNQRPQIEEDPKEIPRNLGASNQRPPLGDRPTEIRPKQDASNPPLTEDPDQPQHFIQTALTASAEWLSARNAFYHHLMPCRTCHAPAGRYFAAGAELRQRYGQTPMTTEKP